MCCQRRLLSNGEQHCSVDYDNYNCKIYLFFVVLFANFCFNCSSIFLSRLQLYHHNLQSGLTKKGQITM